MAEPYLGEIRIFAGNYVPDGWAFCDGSSLSISTYEPLFSLIGTTYGGDGQQSFNLPDLRGRVPIHFSGSNPSLGQSGGSESVTLQALHIAAHTHQLMGDVTVANNPNPGGNLVAQASTFSPYTNGPATIPMAPAAISSTTGSAQPHANVQPFLCINYIIALQGTWPSQS